MADTLATETTVRQLHIRYEGRSFEYPLSEFDIGDLSNDADVKRAVANRLEVPVEKLRNYAVDRHPETGNVTIRPEAVFG